MPLASEVATELRKLADSLDANPDAQLARPSISFHHWLGNGKEKFLAAARLLPRPVTKKVTKDYGSGSDIEVEYLSDALVAYATIPQKLSCELVEPAKPAVYRCEPILSDDEEASIISGTV